MSITLLSDSGTQAGSISDVGIGLDMAADQLGNSLVVTAVGDGGGHLKLIVWHVTSGKTVTRMSDSGPLDTAITLVDLVAAGVERSSGKPRFVCGARTSTGDLQLSTWIVDPASGSISPFYSGPVVDSGGDLFAMCLVDDGSVVVAVRDQYGNLVLKHCAFDDEGILQLISDSADDGQPAGAISAVNVGVVGNVVYSAVIDDGGSLKVILWGFVTNGHLQRLGDSGAQGEPVQSVSALALGNVLVTTVRASDTALKLITWQVSADGSTITRAADSGNAAGGADLINCAALVLNNADPGLFSGDDRIGKVYTAVRNTGGILELVTWDIVYDGTIKRRESFADRPGSLDMLAMTATAQSSAGVAGPYITAVRGSDQGLRLIAWRLDDKAAWYAPLGENMVIHDSYTWENACQVIGPTSSAPKGTVVMQMGESAPNGGVYTGFPINGFVVRDLLDDSADVALTATETLIPYYPTPMLDRATQVAHVDAQIIRLKDGSLLATKNGYAWNDLPQSPEWFNTVHIGGFNDPGASLPPEFTAQAGQQASQQARGVTFVFRSTDAGYTWTQLPFLDAAVVAKGDFGWPQDYPTGYGIGGYDRTEVFQDPFTGRIFVTGHGDGGPYTYGRIRNVSNHAGVVFESTNGGQNWTELGRIPGGKAEAPYVMVSTPNYPLIVLNLQNGVPTLYLLDTSTNQLAPGQSVAIVENGNPVNGAIDAGVNDLRAVPVCIARAGTSGSTDLVWIAYPVLNQWSHQAYKVCLVTLNGTSVSTVEEVVTIQAQDPTSNAVALGCFIQDDLVDTVAADPTSPTDNVTLFYWVEAPPNTAANSNNLLVRCKLLCNSIGQFQTQVLSVADGRPRTFNRLGIGDYSKGGAFAWNGKLNYLAQWGEPDADKANILSPAQDTVDFPPIPGGVAGAGVAAGPKFPTPTPPPAPAFTPAMSPAAAPGQVAGTAGMAKSTTGTSRRGGFFARLWRWLWPFGR